MDISVIGDHLALSLLPWVVAVLIGGGLGYAVALLARHLLPGNNPGLRGAAVLLPWRTVIATVALAALVYPPVQLVGLGQTAGQISVGLFLLALAVPLTADLFLQTWYPSPLAARLLARSRTLAVVAVAAAVMTYNAGAGGAGALIWQGFNRLNDQAVVAGFTIVALLALVADVTLGLIQLLLSPSREDV